MKNDDAILIRLKLAAKQGKGETTLQLFPNEVEELQKEGFTCKLTGGSYYIVSWDNVYADMLLSELKALIRAKEPHNKSEEMAITMVESLLA